MKFVYLEVFLENRLRHFKTRLNCFLMQSLYSIVWCRTCQMLWRESRVRWGIMEAKVGYVQFQNCISKFIDSSYASNLPLRSPVYTRRPEYIPSANGFCSTLIYATHIYSFTPQYDPQMILAWTVSLKIICIIVFKSILDHSYYTDSISELSLKIILMVTPEATWSAFQYSNNLSDCVIV